MEKIIFIHMNQLGDLLFSLPTLAAARKEFPDKYLISLVRPQLAPILESTGLIDKIIVSPKTNLFEYYNLVKILKKENISTAVLFSESPRAIFLSFMAGIPRRIGFSTSYLSFLLTEKIKRKGVPSIGNNLQLSLKIGLKNIPNDYSGLVKISDNEINNVKKLLNLTNIDVDNIVVISPGASFRRKDKCWENKNWIRLIYELQKRGFYPLLIGADFEREYIENIVKGFVNLKENIFLSPSILSLAAVISLSKFFIGIDSGAMHLAASLNVPVIALFGHTDPIQVGPQPLNRHSIIKKNKMSEISVEEVLDRI